jgi:hypothetical protein
MSALGTVQMQQELKSYLSRYDFKCEHALSEELVKPVYDLIMYDAIPKKIDQSNPTFYLYLGFYYWLCKDYDQMKYFYQKAIMKGCNEAQEYYDFNKYKNMTSREKIEKLTDICLTRLKNNPYNIEAIKNAIYYCTYVKPDNNKVMDLRNRLMALEGSIENMVSYAGRCQLNGRYNEMKYFCDLAISENKNRMNEHIKSAICMIVKHNVRTEDYDEAKKYILVNNQYKCSECVNNYLDYSFDAEIAYKFKDILKSHLEKRCNKIVSSYYAMKDLVDCNKIDNDSLSIKKECFVCCETRYILVFTCKHEVCYSCYNKLNYKKCPFCRKSV